MTEYLNCAGKRLDVSQQAVANVMGILNATPDSFSDGGLFVSVADAVQQARSMCEQGAVIVDVGGESTRPGALPVPVQQELDRVIPVIEAICRDCDTIVSIDTSKPEVMREAVNAGAGIINDVRALRLSGALEAASAAVNVKNVAVCLMHMPAEPGVMQNRPEYDNVVEVIVDFLAERIGVCAEAGIAASALLIDPGFGFGKSQQHNLSLVKNLAALKTLERPLLMGVSRKSTIGHLLGRPAGERLAGSLAMATLCYQQGARIIRAHDVAATVDAMKICHAVYAAD
jgi:dihydropteroate synthase